MRTLLITIFYILGFCCDAQIIIKGSVKDNNNNPLPGANIYIKNSYVGATSDTLGNYKFTTTLSDSQILVVSYIGYESLEKSIFPDKKIYEVNFILKESTNSLSAVTINASTFETGDSKRAVLLNSLDIITTANSEGDIYGMLNTLPGAQEESESGKIIVRGGESTETKTYMDGMLILSPYTSQIPDLPSRGRFSPFLFNGLLFSTGGYSAEYGQALSSVLSLNTGALEEESLTSISLLNVGPGLGITRRFTNSSISMEANYQNTALYFAMINHNLDWVKVPETYNGNFQYRKKTGENGMIKTFLSGSSRRSVLNYSDFNLNTPYRIKMNDDYIYHKTTFNTLLKRDWILKTGLSYSISNDTKNAEFYKTADKQYSGHLKIMFEKQKEVISFKTGTEFIFSDKEKVNNYNNINLKLNYNDLLNACFFETDITFNSHLALRIGGRSEYSGYLNKINIAPRATLAYKINNLSQISIASGKFYQYVEDNFMYNNSFLDFESAGHYIINYQYVNNNRVLRFETYLKEYKNLLQFQKNGETYTDISNNGKGFARGFDIFWRDKTTINNVDYWISYSFIDSKRKYRDYPIYATPSFISKHNVSVVLKYWIDLIETELSSSYVFRTGRSYYNPNPAAFQTEKTNNFNDLSLSLSHLTNIFKNFTIIHLSCSNILGFNNIEGYDFENEGDSFQAHPKYPFAKRTIIIGIFVSIK